MRKPSRPFPGSRRPPQNEAEPAHTGGRRGRPKRGGARFPAKGKPQGRGFRGDREGIEEAAPTPVPDDKGIRFSDLLMQLVRRAVPDKIQGAKHPEPLARLDYEQELDLKNRALQEFWTARGLPDKPNRVLPSPRPRGYRTTTKRRVVRKGGAFALAFLTESSTAANPKAGAESLVEPPEHKAIYSFILSKLNTGPYQGLGNSLNYIIIRGDYGRLTVMLNVHKLNADVVRKAKLLADHLKSPEHKVASAFMFFDPTRSEFYFEARDPDGPWKLKKLFGPDDIHLKVLDRTYAFHPTAFCQVNASILPDFLSKAEQLLKPKPEYRLMDLYSGFGFFTLHLGKNYGEAWGVDLGGPAITSAQKMAAAEPATHARFRAGRITAKTLDRLLPPAAVDRPEALLLDPPRQGTEPGVIRALAARNPARILHIFCDMDTLPREVNQWRKAGFMVSKVVPLDMFPGTDNLEVMVLFIPDRYGILNRIDKERFQRTKGEASE
jgi:tRNA/tmRNA/rRNA uracil-C5-methylase (TrmA/RlmC/RlmD family)